MGTITEMAGFEMTRIDLRGRVLTAAQLRAPAAAGRDVDAVLPKVGRSSRPSPNAVRWRPWNSVSPSTACPGSVRVPAAALAGFPAELDPAVRAAPRSRSPRTRTVHADQRRTDTVTQLAPGATVTERWVPVELGRPLCAGRQRRHPSSVVMNVVPAQTAEVDSLVIASPPQADFGVTAPDHLSRSGAARRRGVGRRRGRRRWRC